MDQGTTYSGDGFDKGHQLSKLLSGHVQKGMRPGGRPRTARKMNPPTPPALFPCCIVWCPIPMVTWLFPFVGHMGVCLSSGVILDFCGPYFVSVDNFAFGRTTRYVPLDAIDGVPREVVGSRLWNEFWDENLHMTAQVYRGRFYRFFTDNCHCFVARFLNEIGYWGSSRWDMAKLAGWVFIKGKYVGLGGFLKTWLPFVFIMGLGTYFGGLIFVLSYVCLFLVAVVWFLFCAYFLRPATLGDRD